MIENYLNILRPTDMMWRSPYNAETQTYPASACMTKYVDITTMEQIDLCWFDHEIFAIWKNNS